MIAKNLSLPDFSNKVCSEHGHSPVEVLKTVRNEKIWYFANWASGTYHRDNH